MNFYFPMQTCQVDTEDACLQICLTNKYLPEDRQGTSACQDSGEDPAEKMIRVLLMNGAALHPLRTMPCAESNEPNITFHYLFDLKGMGSLL